MKTGTSSPSTRPRGATAFGHRLRAGARLPLHCTSQGKIVLAYMSESEAANLLARVPLTPYTPHTETDAGALLASLPACREAGFAVENGEYKIGLRSISAPVFTGGGALKYVVSVLGMFRSVHSDEFAHAERAVVARGADALRCAGISGKIAPRIAKIRNLTL